MNNNFASLVSGHDTPSLKIIPSKLIIAFVMLWQTAQVSEGLSFRAIDAEPLARVPANALVLHDGWTFAGEAEVGEEGERISAAGFDDGQWRSTTVPTTVLGALVRHGVYPDPYVGTNNNAIPDSFSETSPWRKPWWFRRNFSLPDGYAGRTVWLNFDGINYRAAVWVNGVQIANETNMAGMFSRFRFDISKLVKPGMTNALAVRIFPVDVPGKPGFRSPGTDATFAKNLTQMSTLGWDWVAPARDRNMGIWQHVWIEATGPVTLRDPAVMTDVELPGGKNASVKLCFQMRHTGEKPVESEVFAEIAPVGFAGKTIVVRRKIQLGAGEVRDVVFDPQEFPQLKIKNPRLWWPHGYGNQPLYRLSISVSVNGKLSHRPAEIRFGIRKLGYFFRPKEFANVLNPPPDGTHPYQYPKEQTARVFTVNGRPIRMEGGSFVPDFLLTWNAQRYRDEVRLMAEGNHTVTRICGVGIIPPDAFFDEADRRGLLVWQDLARSSFGCAWKMKEADLPKIDKDLYLSNMRDVILRLRGRTSLLAWCGINECNMQEDIGKALQDEILPKLDPDRPWLPSTGTLPAWAREPLGTTSFGPYSLQSVADYFKSYASDPNFVFKNEIGLELVPRYNSLVRAVPNPDRSADPSPFKSQALLDHGYSPRSPMTRAVNDTMASPAGVADYLSMAEVLGAESVRAIVEAANKNRPRNNGTLFWMANAAWVDLWFQLYDWHLQPTAAYFRLKSAARPLHVQYAPDDHTLQVSSTLDEAKVVKVRATLYSIDGHQEAAQEYPVTALADATTSLGKAPQLIADGKFHFLRLEMLDKKGVELERDTTWTKHTELASLPPTVASAQVLKKHSENGETRMRIVLRNEGPAPAVHVWVDVIKGALGDQVLPADWDENALTLMPGEEREMTVTCRDAEPGNAPLRLMIEGFNVNPREIVTASGETPSTPRIVVEKLDYADGSLRIECAFTGANGPRYITWPMPLLIDGKLLRCIRVAGNDKNASTTRLALPLSSGEHLIQLGERSVVVQGQDRESQANRLQLPSK
jgi:exo-1,4-beta-D-glucosaminidase